MSKFIIPTSMKRWMVTTNNGVKFPINATTQRKAKAKAKRNGHHVAHIALAVCQPQGDSHVTET